MQLVIDPRGQVRCLYTEALDLAVLGAVRMVRASHVEPDEQGRWWADLAPVQGPRIGPFVLRSQALAAEGLWLEANLLCGRNAVDPLSAAGPDLSRPPSFNEGPAHEPTNEEEALVPARGRSLSGGYWSLGPGVPRRRKLRTGIARRLARSLGHPGLAGHFAGDCACRPGTTCLAVEEILHPRAPDPEDPTAEWSSGSKNKPRHRGYGQDDKDLSPAFLDVCRALESAGIAKAEVSYDGNGDSGAVESFVLYDRRGKEVEAARLPASKFASTWSPPGRELNLGDKLDELVCAILPGGWEINEGSFGTVTLNTLTRRMYVGHSWRIETTNEEAFELDL